MASGCIFRLFELPCQCRFARCTWPLNICCTCLYLTPTFLNMFGEYIIISTCKKNKEQSEKKNLKKSLYNRRRPIIQFSIPYKSKLTKQSNQKSIIIDDIIWKKLPVELLDLIFKWIDSPALAVLFSSYITNETRKNIFNKVYVQHTPDFFIETNQTKLLHNLIYKNNILFEWNLFNRCRHLDDFKSELYNFIN